MVIVEGEIVGIHSLDLSCPYQTTLLTDAPSLKDFAYGWNEANICLESAMRECFQKFGGESVGSSHCPLAVLTPRVHALV